MTRYKILGSNQNKDSNIVIRGKFVTSSSEKWSWYADDNVTFRKVSNSSKPKNHYKSHGDYVGRKTSCWIELKRKKSLPNYATYQTQKFKVQSQGWFTREGFLKNPEEFKKWRKQNPISKQTPIWDYVISFRQKYQEENQIFSSEKAQKLVSKTIDKFFCLNHVDPKAFVYTGAFHVDKPHHFHMHLQIHQKNKSCIDHHTGKDIFRTRGMFLTSSFEKWKDSIDLELQREKKLFKGINYFRNNLAFYTIGGFEDYNQVKEILEQGLEIKKLLPKGRFQYNSYNFKRNPIVKSKLDKLVKKLIYANHKSMLLYEKANQTIDKQIDCKIQQLDLKQDQRTIKNLDQIRRKEKKAEIWSFLANQVLKKIQGMKSISQLPSVKNQQQASIFYQERFQKAISKQILREKQNSKLPSWKTYQSKFIFPNKNWNKKIASLKDFDYEQKQKSTIKNQINHNNQLLKTFKKRQLWEKLFKSLSYSIERDQRLLNEMLRDIDYGW